MHNIIPIIEGQNLENSAERVCKSIEVVWRYFIGVIPKTVPNRKRKRKRSDKSGGSRSEKKKK
jgi:hypothetical protein